MMRRHLAVMLVGLLVSVPACAQAPYWPPIPPPRVEQIPPPPHERLTWQPGHWQWEGREYVWVPGHWIERPAHLQFVPGHWAWREGGWVWIQAHWR